MMQKTLAARIGLSQARLADLEAGRGAGAPPEVWFAIGAVLQRQFRAEFLRDVHAEPEEAGHLQIQELVLRDGKRGGWEGGFEIPTRPADPGRSIDAPLVDRRRRRLAIVECWNTFGNLGAATRSSDRKLAEAEQVAVAMAGAGPPFEVGLCWVVRDTAANRSLVNRYGHIFDARFPGSSAAWVRALTDAKAPMPTQPGLVWCDVRAGRLFSRRRARQVRNSN